MSLSAAEDQDTIFAATMSNLPKDISKQYYYQLL